MMNIRANALEMKRYESIKEYTVPPAKQTGQLGGAFPPTPCGDELQELIPSIGDSPHTKSEKPGIPYGSDDSTEKERKEDAEQARKLALGETTANSSGYADKGTVDHTFFLLNSVYENSRHRKENPKLRILYTRPEARDPR